MKRYGNLFDKAFNMENMYAAYMDARKGKRKKRACFEFELALGANLERLRDEIYGRLINRSRTLISWYMSQNHD